MANLIWPLSAAAAFYVVVAVAGALATDIGAWYRALSKPWFQPPDWLFGPAWTLIFGLTAVAVALAWQEANPNGMRQQFLAAVVINGILNVLWSVLFFTLRRPDWALAEVVLLWVSIAYMIYLAAQISSAAAWLLAPYLAWVSFASVLNLAIVWLNRAA